MAGDAFVLHILYLARDVFFAALATLPSIVGLAIELLKTLFWHWYRGTFTFQFYDHKYTVKYVDLCLYIAGCACLIYAYVLVGRAFVSLRSLFYYDRASTAYRTLPVSAFYPTTTDFVPEGAWGGQASFSLSKSDVVPQGVFQILEKNTETSEYLHVGFGVLISGYPYTAYHVVCNPSAHYYASLPGRNIKVPIKVDPSCTSISEDWCLLTCSNLGSILGIKSVGVGCITQGAITVYHFDSSDQTFDTQCVYPTPYDRANQLPIHIYSRSNTAPSDSGLPVMQKGKVVGIHVGSLPRKKQNVHVIPTDLMLEMAKSRAGQQVPVFDYLSESIPFSKDSEQLGDLVSFKKRKEEEKRKRALGEHLDYQGYPELPDSGHQAPSAWSRKSEQEFLNPSFKGASWADLYDEETLKEVAPTRGALLSSPGVLKLQEEIAQLRSSISSLTLLVTTGSQPVAPVPSVSTAPDSSMVEVEVPTEMQSDTLVSQQSLGTPSSKRKRTRSKKSKSSSLGSVPSLDSTTTLQKGTQ